MRIASLGVLVVGILIGGVLRHFVFDAAPNEQRATSNEQLSAPAISEQQRSSGRFDATAQRLDALERELKRLQLAADAGVTVQPVRPPAAAEGLALKDAAEQRLAQFERESVDTTWAPRMRGEIDKALAEIEASGSVHFRSSVECRSSRCLARLTWPDFKTARDEYMLADTPSLECARSLHLDEPRDVEAPFEAKLMFECKR